MAMITVGKENSTAIDLYYEDHGAGTPVVLIHDNYDVNGAKLVSDRVLEDNWNVAAGASAIGTLQCVDAWVEDFRKDTARNSVPTLIIHGDADRILPPDATSRRQAKMIKHVKFAEIAGGPHGLCWTHADRVNAELVPFVE
jgi:non-heme chloroperoxidase